MPSFKTLSKDEVESLNRRRSNVEDLKEYVEFLKDVPAGSWGSIELAKDDTQRTVKRRTSLAATSLGKAIRWRLNRGNASTLIFQVAAKK